MRNKLKSEKLKAKSTKMQSIFDVGADALKSARKEKGITLIALIITIIIMLILVAVTIDIAVDGKLFDKAQEAVDKTNDKVGQTQDRIDEWMGKLDTIPGGSSSGGENNGETVLGEETTTEGNTTLTVRLLSTKSPVTADGSKVKEIKQGAPIPVDFYYVGGTMDTGIVISDSSADANKGDGHDVELEGNQFVWVPVLQNQRMEIEIKSNDEITALTIEDELAREITKDREGQTISPSGTSYTVEINPPINGLYTITAEVGTETITETIHISSLYAQDFLIEDIIEYMVATGQLPEADIEDMRAQGIQFNSEFSDTTIATYAPSVNKYGGFYIARYEAGTDTARTYSGASDVSATVYSKKDMYPYNYINHTDAISKAAEIDGGKANVTSALINAAAWDRTLNWLVETKAITVNDTTNELLDSTSWGNDANSLLEFSGKYAVLNSYTGALSWDEGTAEEPENTAYLLGTGISEYTNRNNIYDLAGNCLECTTEAISSGDVVSRGGTYRADSSPASVRVDTVASDRDSYVGFRPALYIN